MAEAGGKQAAPLPAAEAPFDAIGLAKELLRTIRSGALATLERDGAAPFASLVTVATDLDGTPLLLLSRLSAHTLNLEADPRCSILLARGGKGDPLAHPRLTVTGIAERSDEARVRARFLARHPKAALYADFPDFAFFRLAVRAGHLNGGFARAATLTGPELLTDLSGLEALAESEAGAVAHMNEDHADAVALYATRLAGEEPGPWRLTGFDPEGLDLMAGERTARVAFPERLADPASLRPALVAMAAKARAVPDSRAIPRS
ncbi:pyridoxamine 5'-phosphate oxidase [Methylobacterium terrae]|uniref:Pyridoxamine 5'-phosphate oxidase n=1 Tax=Methylobacterium terrae TaxID=2202827 RepID=A0A2U8WY87_9HYPH|nr:pyridoxamine 5'-phosphate oxidase [Methylobacterium terrae]